MRMPRPAGHIPAAQRKQLRVSTGGVKLPSVAKNALRRNIRAAMPRAPRKIK